ncbi:MAG: DUF4190 domain-containing protein [Candidatus Sumerlaeota bacterium]|nr:DUF4190 domain-containing protein [Candidatus Sumerlaeota bacterium]
MKPHRGILILVLGILGMVVCLPCGIAAWIMGSRDLKEMDAGRMDPNGRGQTYAGRVLGMIATILAIIALVVAIALALFIFFLNVSERKPTQPAGWPRSSYGETAKEEPTLTEQTARPEQTARQRAVQEDNMGAGAAATGTNLAPLSTQPGAPKMPAPGKGESIQPLDAGKPKPTNLP